MGFFLPHEIENCSMSSALYRRLIPLHLTNPLSSILHGHISISITFSKVFSTMLIPRFSLSQTATHLSITIRCPYVKFSSVNDDTNGIEVDLPTPDEFYFACKPYYLHLHLPGHVIAKDLPDYKYDIETSSFCFTYEKETANEHFEELDMINKLLHRKPNVSTHGIEELEQDLENNEDDEEDDEPLWNQMRQLEIDGKEIPFTSHISLSLYSDQPKENLISSYSYGFNHQHEKLFSNFDAEYSLIFDNQSPDTLSTSLIRSSRLEKEQSDFNLEHYLADKYELDDPSIFQYQWNISDQLNDQDRDDLKNLKSKQLIIDDPIPIYLGLIDLLYAFAYDQRLTQ